MKYMILLFAILTGSTHIQGYNGYFSDSSNEEYYADDEHSDSEWENSDEYDSVRLNPVSFSTLPANGFARLALRVRHQDEILQSMVQTHRTMHDSHTYTQWAIALTMKSGLLIIVPPILVWFMYSAVNGVMGSLN